MKVTEKKLQHLQSLTGLEADTAMEALKRSNGDELEALEWLSRKRKILDSGLGFYSTAEAKAQPGVVLTPVSGRRARQRVNEPPLTLGERIWMFFIWNRLVARRKNDRRRSLECPLGVLLGLLVIAWYVVALLLALGLALGWRYRLEGPQMKGLQMKQGLRRVRGRVKPKRKR